MLAKVAITDVHEIFDLLQRPVDQASRPLGEILLASRLITEHQLMLSLRRQRNEQHQQLGYILVEMGLVSPGQVMAALALKCGIPYVGLEGCEISRLVLQQVPAQLVIQYNLVPLAVVGRRLIVASDNPLRMEGIELLQFKTGLQVIPVMASAADLARLIARHYSRVGDQPELDAIPLSFNDAPRQASSPQARMLELAANRRPIVRLVNAIFLQALIRSASDINIRPLPAQVHVYYRIDGLMRWARTIPVEDLNPLVSRIKIMAGMDITERRLAQDGHIRMQHGHRSIDLRVSVIPTVQGESLAIRVLDRDRGLRSFDELGLSPVAQQQVRGCIGRGAGLFVVAGPTGSGKSTTLYSVLNELQQRELHILTVEEPIEYEIAGVEQVQVSRRKGLGFASALRHFLRHDPDVIMIGEIRDQETAEIACRAALTGHLVLTTLHTRTAHETLTRLLDMGIQRYVLSAVLVGIVAQRLIRRLCPVCKQVEDVSVARRLQTGIGPDQIVYRSLGCEHCQDSGYQGRLLLTEVMTIDVEMRTLINDASPATVLIERAERAGMLRLERQALDLAVTGQVTLDEALAIGQE